MTGMGAEMGVFDLPVFAPADVFPMMADDELAELAADIKANGLREPLVIAEIADGDGVLQDVLVDGRNRRAACKIAGVEPTTRQLEGDPTAYVLSANIHRRHMTKGQRAMAVAMIYPVAPNKGGRGKTSQESWGLSGELVRQARLVLAHSAPLAHAVLTGLTSLDAAYNEARIASGRLNGEEARLRELGKSRPDLAAKVRDEEMTLAAAEQSAKEEAEAIKSLRWATTRNIIDAMRGLSGNIEFARETAANIDHHYAKEFQEPVTPQRLREAAAFASALADELEKKQ